MLAEACKNLGVSIPSYIYEKNASASAVFSVSARFSLCDQRFLGLFGCVGEVCDISGKKNAREACAKEVLRLLAHAEEAKEHERQRRAGMLFRPPSSHETYFPGVGAGVAYQSVDGMQFVQIGVLQ